MRASNPKIVPREFKEDFDFVAAHYGFGPGTDEYDLAKQQARVDLDAAIVCFADIAQKLKGEKA